MWFCKSCKWWFHFHCCQPLGTKQRFKELKDFVSMPLVKGGALGLAGTAPLAFAAAEIMKQVEDEGGSIANRWQELLERAWGYKVEKFPGEEFHGAEYAVENAVVCPACGVAC